MTRDEARLRRKRMAQDVGGGKGIHDVAATYAVSVALVRKACREFGEDGDGKRSTKKRAAPKQLIADLRTGKSPDDVAKDNRVSVGRVVRLQERVASGLPQK